jgi:O-antigen ligase
VEGTRKKLFMAIQTTLARVGERPKVQNWLAKPPSDGRRRFIFGATLAFSALYYYRPEDFIKPLAYVPMAKLAGGIGFVGLLVGLMGGSKVRTPKAIKILWLLLFQMTICIPTALWVGGAFHTVFDRFFKGVIVAMLISMCVVTVRELRKLLWIQVSAVALVTFFSIAFRHYDPDGRLSGIQNGILFNPNDLAANIAISFPLGLAFLLHARGSKKVIWALSLAVMSVGVVLTGSRSGLLALIISIMVSVWEYGIQGKRRHLVVITIVVFLIGFGIAISSSHYRARVESIFLGNVAGSGDKGSLAARKELLKKSVMTALTHPIFGVGPGCFPLVDESWRVAHNSYTELAAEAGLPALALFLLAIWAAFKNLGQMRKSQQYQDDPEFRLFTQALWAGLAAYMAGACFASVEYNLYSYLLVAYTCAMVRISNQGQPDEVQESKPRILSRAKHGAILKPQTLRMR